MTENNSMIDAVENTKVTEVYEVIKEAEPLPKLIGEAEYNYDNVVDELVNIRDVIALNLFKTITNINKKLLNGRIKDKETEKIRLEYYKQYVNICNSINNFTKDASYRIPTDKLKDLLDMNTNENNFNKEIKKFKEKDSSVSDDP